MLSTAEGHGPSKNMFKELSVIDVHASQPKTDVDDNVQRLTSCGKAMLLQIIKWLSYSFKGICQPFCHNLSNTFAVVKLYLK